MASTSFEACITAIIIIRSVFHLCRFSRKYLSILQTSYRTKSIGLVFEGREQRPSQWLKGKARKTPLPKAGLAASASYRKAVHLSAHPAAGVALFITAAETAKRHTGKPTTKRTQQSKTSISKISILLCTHYYHALPSFLQI